jgi:RHH-type transcriptional regulator, proline utilization regulon repressor / proline dehydrogenase / delta 1-pyrroline-5-carboxylate dehydrogenase
VLAENGYRVRIYVPIGDLLPGMAYLVRRLLENTSTSGFLRRSYHDGVAVSAMLEPPVLDPEAGRNGTLVPGDIDSPFGNAGLLDFCEQKVRDAFAEAVAAVKLQSAPRHPPGGGRQIRHDRKRASACLSQ